MVRKLGCDSDETGPYSPDMNPIENVWRMMKDWVIQHHPELNEMGDSE